MTEDEVIGWHHRLNGHEFEPALGNGEVQGSLWCWRRILRVPRTARRSNQSVLKKINPEYSLEGLMLKL